jgi:Tfp pilus assembly protein PilO
MSAADLIRWIAAARRHLVSTLCAIVCILSAVASWFIHSNMKWLELEQKQLAQDGDLMIATLTTGPSVRQELAAARETTRRIEDNLVVEDNLAENLWYFYKIEQQTKARLELHQLNSIPSDSRALYKRIPYSVRVTGTYEQAGAFLYALETGPRLANITSMNIRRHEPGSLVLELDINLELLGKK